MPDASSSQFSPIDVIESGRWRSATFTTFALSLSFFESFVLPVLRASGCREVTIFVDPLGYRNSLIERQLIGAGVSYQLIPTTARGGAFHCKVCYLEAQRPADPDAVVIGSGNLTYGGYGGNLELLEVFWSDEHPSVFADLATGFEAGLTSDSVHVPAKGSLNRLIERSRAVAQGMAVTPNTRLLSSAVQPIGQSIVDAAAAFGPCNTLTLLSPYFEGLPAVERLWRALGQPLIQVAIPSSEKQLTRFPFAEALTRALPVRAVSSELLRARPFHGKLVELDCAEGALTISGSANVTWPALWAATNFELSVLRVTPEPQRLFDWYEVDQPARVDLAPLEHVGNQTVCVFAELSDDNILKGQVLSGFDPAGVWAWSIYNRSGSIGDGSIELDADGHFEIRDAQLRLDAGACQIRLTRLGYATAEGWINQIGLLQSRQRFGPTLDAILLTVAGENTDQDLSAVIEWLCRTDLAGRPTGHRKGSHTRDGRTARPIPIAALDPKALPDNVPHAPGQGETTLLQKLLDGLRRRFRSAQLEPPDEPDDEPTSDPKQVARKIAKKQQRYGNLLRSLDESHDILWAAAEDSQLSDPSRRTAAVWLLDLSFYVYSQHPGGPHDSALPFAHRWVDKICNMFTAFEGDELDRAVTTLAATLAAIDNRQHTRLPEQIHLMLQRYTKSPRGEGLSQWLREPAFRGMDALGLPPTANLNASLATIVSTITNWMRAQNILDEARSGATVSIPPSYPAGASADCSASFYRRLQGIVGAGTWAKRIRPSHTANVCPKCNLSLPRAQQHDLRANYIICCSHCGCVIVKTTA
jgi:hypothetical protein